MNIFATHPNPAVCARQHCDVHVIKMIVETAQLLSTAHVVVGGEQVAYRKTHEHHPCAVWVRQSAQNYAWCLDLFKALLAEYQFRFEKVHASAIHLPALSHIPVLPDIGRTAFAQAMPDEFRADNPHRAYRRYLKAKLSSWLSRPSPMRTCFTRREVPEFLRGISPRKYPVIHLGVHYEYQRRSDRAQSSAAFQPDRQASPVQSLAGATARNLDLAVGAGEQSRRP